MIVDRLDHWKDVFHGPAWSKAFQELERIAASLAGLTDGDHEIQGVDVVLKAMRYDTKPRASGVLEAHRDFIDIQCVLSGEEIIEWHALEGLQVKTPYDAQKDATFFEPPARAGATIHLKPGMFVVLFDRDAHMASLVSGAGPVPVHKVVIKLRASLVQDPFTWR